MQTFQQKRYKNNYTLTSLAPTILLFLYPFDSYSRNDTSIKGYFIAILKYP